MSNTDHVRAGGQWDTPMNYFHTSRQRRRSHTDEETERLSEATFEAKGKAREAEMRFEMMKESRLEFLETCTPYPCHVAVRPFLLHYIAAAIVVLFQDIYPIFRGNLI